MDYEKAYKEALERATTLFKNSKGMILKKWVEQVFPELKESEDERIRKALISFVNNDGWKFTKLTKEEKESWIAWLEKHREQMPKWTDEDEQYLLVCKNALRKYQVSDKWDADIISKWLEDKLKQGEQKPNWSEDDERERKRVVGLLEGWLTTFKETYYAEECKFGIEWLKSLKKRMGNEKVEESSDAADG